MYYSEEKPINGRSYVIRRLPWGKAGVPGTMRHVMATISAELKSSFLGILSKDIEDLGGIAELLTGEVLRAALVFLADINTQAMEGVFSALGSNTDVTDPTQGNVVRLTAEQQVNWWSEHPEDFFPWLEAALIVNFKDFFSGFANTAIGGRLRSAQGSPPPEESASASPGN